MGDTFYIGMELPAVSSEKVCGSLGSYKYMTSIAVF